MEIIIIYPSARKQRTYNADLSLQKKKNNKNNLRSKIPKEKQSKRAA